MIPTPELTIPLPTLNTQSDKFTAVFSATFLWELKVRNIGNEAIESVVEIDKLDFRRRLDYLDAILEESIEKMHASDGATRESVVPSFYVPFGYNKQGCEFEVVCFDPVQAKFCFISFAPSDKWSFLEEVYSPNASPKWAQKMFTISKDYIRAEGERRKKEVVEADKAKLGPASPDLCKMLGIKESDVSQLTSLGTTSPPSNGKKTSTRHGDFNGYGKDHHPKYNSDGSTKDLDDDIDRAVKTALNGPHPTPRYPVDTAKVDESDESVYRIIGEYIASKPETWWRSVSSAAREVEVRFVVDSLLYAKKRLDYQRR